MRPWQFSRPKGPGFGISRGFYLSVLSSRAILPSVYEVVNPRGEGGAVVGFGVPLAQGAEKDALRQPLTRGAYALATRDRKTVIKMLVLSKEEAGYDPEAFARSELAVGADPELLARMRGTWTLAQLTFESHDPAVYPALDFLLSTSRRLAELSEGVVADPIARRYALPHGVASPGRADPRVDARDHVATHFRARPDGIHAFTLGLQKFALPELELPGLMHGDEPAAGRFLVVLSQRALLGNPIQSGDRFGPFEAREGGFDRALWEGIPVLELLPPTAQSATEALREVAG